MAANSGLPEGTSFSWGEMWTPLNWLCIEFFVITGHVLYMWYAPRHHECVIFLTISDFELESHRNNFQSTAFIFPFAVFK